MHQLSLLSAPVTEWPKGWQPDSPPDLTGVSELHMDTETRGLRWWAGEGIVSLSLHTSDGRGFFLPFGHKDGNLPEDAVKRWAKTELKNKKITFFNAAFDIHQLYQWGVDLEAQGCRVSDTAHSAALLDDHRRPGTNSLDAVAREWLGEGKVGDDLDKAAMDRYPAWDVEKYALRDSWLVRELSNKMAPALRAEDLGAVQNLEDDCIWATCEMERNGAPLDQELLEKWVSQSEVEYLQALGQLQREAGFLIKPARREDLMQLFDKLIIPYPVSRDPALLRQGITKVTFEKRYLAEIDHPTMALVRKVRRLESVRNKYLVPYLKEVRKNGLLRYALHQLRAGGEGEVDAGTISGRYSSSAYSTGDGANIQQVAGKKFQHSVKEDADWPYHIRKLFVPRSGLFLAGDADQIEYRWFAHYARPPMVMEAYAKDSSTNFHKAVREVIQQFQPITYELTKDCNFACVPVDTPILTKNLEWKDAGSFQVGDELLAFDEDPRRDDDGLTLPGRSGCRRWQASEVISNQTDERECFELYLEDGSTLTSTADHRWLMRNIAAGWEWKWVTTAEVKKKLTSRQHNTRSSLEVLRALQVEPRNMSWEAGWAAGFMDGEGWTSGFHLLSGKGSSAIGCNQNAGPTFDMAEKILNSLYPASGKRFVKHIENCGTSSTWALELRGCTADRMEFLMRIRPERLISKFANSLQGCILQAKNGAGIRVLDIAPIGKKTVAVLNTSSRTYVAQGFASHNCLFGAGLGQFAFMLSMTEDKAKPIYDLYHQALPEAKWLYKRAMRTAQIRGWVKTTMGRRARFTGEHQGFCSKAVSRIIQGSAAEENKTKLVALRRAKTGMVLRFTVHDEVGGDVPDMETAKKVSEVLNTQILPCRVPLLWSVNVGPSWQECKKVA